MLDLFQILVSPQNPNDFAPVRQRVLFPTFYPHSQANSETGVLVRSNDGLSVTRWA
jgi:hypothetical protein